MRISFGGKTMARLGMAAGVSVAVMTGPATAALASPSGVTLVGFSATTQAIGAQFAFNVPGVVPLPNENLIEEDVPFSRVNVGGGPVVDSLSAPYYPGDVAANLGSLLTTFGGTPPAGSPLAPSIFSAVSHAAVGGGDATAAISDLALDSLGSKAPLPVPGAPSGASSLLDVGNVSAANTVGVGSSSIQATSTSQVKAINIAGMVDISGLTGTAAATSDGTTATPTASLQLGQVTVDGVKAFIDNTGVHIAATSTGTLGVTPATLQTTLNATLAQDGISIRVLDPKLTTNGAEGTANAGGLSVALAHQFDVPFIPGEPTIPVPQLGNVGLPAGLYTVTTSITFGMAQVDVSATALAAGNATGSGAAGSGSTDAGGVTPPDSSSFGSSSGTGLATLGDTSGAVQDLSTTGPGSADANRTLPIATSATAFPIPGVPAPLGWAVGALLLCILLAYPLLLVARWQFLAGRRP